MLLAMPQNTGEKNEFMTLSHTVAVVAVAVAVVAAAAIAVAAIAVADFHCSVTACQPT